MGRETIPNRDERRKIRKQVEGALEKYRLYLLSIPEDKLPRVTASYSLVPGGQSDPSSSSWAERAAIEKVDYERERMEYIQTIQDAVNRLNSKERQIIIKRYMVDDEAVYDYEIFNDMGISESFYYKIKRQAYDKLAVLFGLYDVDELMRHKA
ncbi:ArpU family phage packaging/lysis transcriptional regulator [Bacillus infantis]|uniref:ArpU family phage packaging/lysis transcriptional regulator n=1 Tax=Bacillus infantis TaxID=324767 RepID=UPI003CEC8BE9